MFLHAGFVHLLSNLVMQLRLAILLVRTGAYFPQRFARARLRSRGCLAQGSGTPWGRGCGHGVWLHVRVLLLLFFLGGGGRSLAGA
jgi:hypothetical protein